MTMPRTYRLIAWVLDGLRWMRQDLREHLCFTVGHDWNMLGLKPLTIRQDCRRCGVRALEWDNLMRKILETPITKMFRRLEFYDVEPKPFRVPIRYDSTVLGGRVETSYSLRVGGA